MKLITETRRGGAEGACAHYNMLAIAEYAMSMHQFVDPSWPGACLTVTVFNVPDENVASVWRKLGRPSETCPVQPKTGDRW